MTNTQLETVFSGNATSGDGALPVDSIASKVESGIKGLESLSLDDFVNKAVQGMIDFAIHLAIAIAVFYIGKFIISKIYKVVATLFIKRSLDRSLTTFVLSLIRIVLYFILIVTVIGILGIETSSFLAIFASAGVAVGLALSGTLQNFAGGVLILLLKPYKIGDYIEAQGFAGTVKEIQIFSTVINTPDNKQIIIPNGPLSTGSINNYSKEDYRRIDWTVSIAYGDDFDVARDAILRILTSDDRVVKGDIEDSRTANFVDHAANVVDDDDTEPRRSWLGRIFSVKSAPQALSRKIEEHHARMVAMLPKTDGTPRVFLASLGASSVDISVRAWSKAADYWGVYFDMNRRFYKELPGYGINFPFPQMDVHIKQD